MIHAILIRYWRWRVFRTPPGSPARHVTVQQYMAWQRRNRRLD